MSLVKSIVAVLLLGCLVGGAGAQAHGEVHWRELPGADQLAIGCAWEQPGAAGRPGVARLLAECRLVRARAAAPSVRSCVVHVDPERRCIVGVVDAGDVAGARAFLAALLDDAMPLADDTLATLVARVALAADDAATLYPGDVLAARAAVAFGIAASIDSLGLLDLPPARVRELLADPANTIAAGVGAVGEAMRQMVGTLEWSPPAPDWRAATVAGNAPRAVGITSELHARCDAPWVMAAFAVPTDVAKPALALALEVARARAVRAMRSRGAEASAHAPFVAWSWLAGDPLVRVHRRAADPVQRLPGEREQGDAAFAATAARAELDAFLADLRSRPPSAAELDAARERVLAEHGLSLQARPADAALLPGIAVVELLRRPRGIEPTALAAVGPEQAHAALQALLHSDRAYRHELLPLPRADRHWPRR